MSGHGHHIKNRLIRVALLVNGFPDPTQPWRGLANLRTARALGELTDLKVVFLRSWRPGRLLFRLTEFEYGGVPVTTLAIPQLPLSSAGGFLINVALYRSLGWLSLRSVLKTRNLIHSVDALPGIVGSSWAKRTGIHHVNQATGGDINTILPRIRIARTVTGWEKHIHGVACVSKKIEDGYRSLYPCVQNIRTVYRGVDINRFQPVGPKAGPLADRPPVRFLFLGGFPAYSTQPYQANTKGGQTLLTAWHMAEREMIAANASLMIAGPECDNVWIATWKRTLREPSRVHVAGLIPPESISAYIRAADVVLIPSMQEGLPVVAMEASACAKPVFGSNVGGIPEVVVHNDTGLLIPADDMAAWGNALVEYCHAPSILKTMGERARQRMEALFNCDRYAQQILDLYQAALSRPICQSEFHQ